MTAAPSVQQVLREKHEADHHAGAPRASVAIGFGSVASESGVTRLDLHDILIRHAQATFLMRAAGESMSALGISSGDLLLIDRALTPSHGHVVIAVVDDEFVCRQLCKGHDGLRLRATQAQREAREFQVWGVVTHVIKALPG